MNIVQPEKWAHIQAVNSGDHYSHRCVTYAEQWADLMEAKLAAGESLESVASSAASEADTDGITGFMYGAAVSILSEVWEHGDRLRRWHNLDIQVGNEGQIANEKGTTLNPALLVVAD